MDFKFTVLANAFTTAQCAKASSMLAIKGPHNAPSLALKGEKVNDISHIAKVLSGLGRYCKCKSWTTIRKSVHSRNRSGRMSAGRMSASLTGWNFTQSRTLQAATSSALQLR